MILRILGVLLLVAAGLKLHGLAAAPVGSAGFFSAPWLQMPIVQWEITLGTWLISGFRRPLAWLAATATFLAFATLSFWQGLIGQVTCGCLGAIKVNPWMAFGIDVAALTLLAVTYREAAPAAGQFAVPLRFLVTGTCGVLFLLGLLAGIGTLAFGSPAASLAYLRGETLI